MAIDSLNGGALVGVRVMRQCTYILLYFIDLTFSALPSYAADDVLIFAVSFTSITVSWHAWEVGSNNPGDGPVIGYRIKYGRSDQSLFTINGDSMRSHVFQNLQPKTRYQFCLVVVRGGIHGDGPCSNMQYKHTCEGKSNFMNNNY